MREFDVNGVIVSNDDSWIYDWFGYENTCPSMIRSFLKEANGEDVQFNINSNGGDLYSGVNIHDMIKGYNGNVEIRVSGLAASAASIIAMAGRCLMSPASMLMIHNTACQDYGNKRDKTKMASDLGIHDKAIAAVYSAKTGIEVSEILRMMDKETYLDAQTALEQGFIDGVLTDDMQPAMKVSNAVGNGLLPQNVIDEIRQYKQGKAQPPQSNGVPVEQLKKRLSLLRR